MGANSKLQLQFVDRHWHGLGCNGETFADTGYQCTWEASRAQPGASGILVVFTGGTLSARANQTTLDEHAMKFLGQIEPVLAGISAKWNRKDILDYWPDIVGVKAPILTGKSASTPVSRELKECVKATVTSPANTRPLNPKVTSTAQSSPVSAPPGKSWVTCDEINHRHPFPRPSVAIEVCEMFGTFGLHDATLLHSTNPLWQLLRFSARWTLKERSTLLWPIKFGSVAIRSS